MTTKHLVAAFAALALGALSLEAKDTVFFVGCHPDDIENCLGLMLRMREKYDIQVIDFTRGENGCGPAGYADGTTAVKRIAEEREVCKAFGCEPIFLSQINHNAMAHAVPGGVLEEFAISKTMKPVTWSPDMRWWYKDEFDSLFPKKRSAK